jgi:hypothetical protein
VPSCYGPQRSAGAAAIRGATVNQSFYGRQALASSRAFRYTWASPGRPQEDSPTKEARNGLRLTITNNTRLHDGTVSTTQETATHARDSGYTVGYITWTTGTPWPAYHQPFPTVDHTTGDWIYKDTHFSIMYLVLRDQSHIVTWLLPLVLCTSQFTFKTT